MALLFRIGMGRRKKPTRKLQVGTFYFIDRRIKSFQVLKKVMSRQNSLNASPGNLRTFNVLGAPENNALMVASHERFFGKDYSKIMIGNTNQDILIGYILVSDLQKIIQGKLKWVRTTSEEFS